MLGAFDSRLAWLSEAIEAQEDRAPAEPPREVIVTPLRVFPELELVNGGATDHPMTASLSSKPPEPLRRLSGILETEPCHTQRMTRFAATSRVYCHEHCSKSTAGSCHQSTMEYYPPTAQPPQWLRMPWLAAAQFETRRRFSHGLTAELLSGTICSCPHAQISLNTILGAHPLRRAAFRCHSSTTNKRQVLC